MQKSRNTAAAGRTPIFRNLPECHRKTIKTAAYPYSNMMPIPL
ncbi:hypothetical protein [Neisseria sp.]